MKSLLRALPTSVVSLLVASIMMWIVCLIMRLSSSHAIHADDILPPGQIMTLCLVFHGLYAWTLCARYRAGTLTARALCTILSVVLWAEVGYLDRVNDPSTLPLYLVFGLTLGTAIDSAGFNQSVADLKNILGRAAFGTAVISGRQLFTVMRAVGQGLSAVETRVIKANARLDRYALMRMTSQLGVMLGAGITVVRSIGALALQEHNPPLRVALDSVVNDLYGGSNLSKALAAHPKVFDTFYVGMVKVGETTGRYDRALIDLSRYLERDINLMRRAKSAMTYPILVLFVCIIVVWAIFVFVIPQLLATFTSLARPDTPLPLPTRILQAMVTVCTNPWCQFGTLLLLLSSILFYREYNRTAQGKYNLDTIKLSLPVLGHFSTQVVMASFFRSLGTLMNQGIPIMQALGIVIESEENLYFRQTVLVPLKEQVSQGVNISQVMKALDIFPTIAVGMVSVGDETGVVPGMLLRLATMYDEQVTRALDQLVTVLEPVLICIMGVLVGFVLISVFMPLYDVVMSING